MSIGAVPLPAPAPGSWCGLTWRRSSENDGPGSVCRANSGNELGSDIERGAYSRISGAQCNQAVPSDSRQLVIGEEVGRDCDCTIGIVSELADRDVAVPAE